jgi:hypothetical protein
VLDAAERVHAHRRADDPALDPAPAVVDDAPGAPPLTAEAGLRAMAAAAAAPHVPVGAHIEGEGD